MPTANEKTTVFAEGTFFWFKILREDQLKENFDGDGKEYSLNFIPDDDGAFLAPFKLQDGTFGRMKDPQEGMPGRFLNLKQREKSKEGKPNKLVKVEDADGMAWDRDVDVGNGSRGVIKLQVADYGKGTKNIGLYIQAVRIDTLVPYEKKSGFADYDATKGTKPAGAKKPNPTSKAKASFELDDDIAF